MYLLVAQISFIGGTKQLSGKTTQHNDLPGNFEKKLLQKGNLNNTVQVFFHADDEARPSD